MKTRSVAVIVVGVVLVAGALLAQGPFQGNGRPGHGPLAQFLGQDAEFTPGIRGQLARGGPGARGRHGLTAYLLVEYLDLTDAQKAVLEDARDAARGELTENLKVLGANHRLIREASDRGDTAQVGTLAQEQGDLIASMIVAHAARRAEVEQQLALTVEQQAKVEKLKQHFKDRAEERINRFRDWFGGETPDQP